jgi:hypothetical protein
MVAIAHMTVTLGTPEVLTTGDIARMFRVAPRTAGKWIDSGMLRGYRIPAANGRPGDRRVRREDAIAFANEHGIPIEAMAEGRESRVESRGPDDWHSGPRPSTIDHRPPLAEAACEVTNHGCHG